MKYLYFLVGAGLVLLSGLPVSFAGEPSFEPMLQVDSGGHTDSINSIATDNSGHWLVTASQDKTARIWNLNTGHLEKTLHIPLGGNYEGILLAVDISSDGNTIALSGFTGYEWDKSIAVYLFDRVSGRMLRRITDLPDVVSHLAFSADDRLLAVAFSTGGLKLFSASDGRLLDKDSDYVGKVQSLHFSKDGRLVTTCEDGFLRLYQVGDRHLALLNKQTTLLNKKPYDAKFSPDGQLIAVGLLDSQSIQIFDGQTLQFTFGTGLEGAPYDVVSDSLFNVAWSPDGAWLFAAGMQQRGNRNIIRRWSIKGRSAINSVDWKTGTNNNIFDIAALPKGRIAFASAEPTWGVVDASGKQETFHSSKLADFSLMQKGFALSTDARQVRFSYEKWGKALSVFDIASREFLPANTTRLSPSVETFPGIEVDWYEKNALFLTILSEPKINGVAIEFQSGEMPRVFAIDNKSKHLIVGSTHRLFALNTKGKMVWQLPIASLPLSVNVSQDGRWVVAAYSDGTIRWHRASDGVEQLAFFPLADRKRWIMWTPEGYYDASPGAEDLIGWHLNQGKDKEARFIPSGQLYDVFFRPDIVQAKFRGEDISSLITITAAQALKYPPPILSFTKVPSTTSSNKEKVCYKAVATGGGIGEIRLFQNGKLIKSDGFYRETTVKERAADAFVKLASMDSANVTRALKLTKTAQKSEPPMVSNSKGNKYEECQEIETIPGDNEISVAAFNANNTIQSSLETAHFTSERKAEDPHLYVLGIGINKYASSENNLKYAVKDANDFRSMIQDKAKGLFKMQNIHIEGLNDADATKVGIKKAIEAISTKIKPWDSFVLFVASHGYLQDNQYYIVTADFDGNINTDKMISSNEIVGMSKNIKSLSQLLIFDTCHAGGVDNIIGGLYDARMSVMAKKMGLHIYASAGSTQTALDGYKGNGLFTHALLDSMKSTATDSNHDKEVSVAELGESAKQETMGISKKLGFPQSPNIINFGKDNALFRVK